MTILTGGAAKSKDGSINRTLTEIKYGENGPASTGPVAGISVRGDGVRASAKGRCSGRKTEPLESVPKTVKQHGTIHLVSN